MASSNSKLEEVFRLLLLKNGSRLNGFFACFFLGNCDFNAVSELRSLKARLEELESDLRDRDEEIQNLKSEGNQQKAVNGEESDIVKVDFETSDIFISQFQSWFFFSECANGERCPEEDFGQSSKSIGHIIGCARIAT